MRKVCPFLNEKEEKSYSGPFQSNCVAFDVRCCGHTTRAKSKAYGRNDFLLLGIYHVRLQTKYGVAFL
ncbi:hypothetical protein FRX31_030598 [Thalictrum thalictroides]|uniref:Uncharacterized protein n=1 Tax=Thalictrum thalictroides TaxID=46969 RepID=A0A7J6V6K6_THATH|nr:hypothetical protein FRX31_030598 [Thalictrum thalictroides]